MTNLEPTLEELLNQKPELILIQEGAAENEEVRRTIKVELENDFAFRVGWEKKRLKKKLKSKAQRKKERVRKEIDNLPHKERNKHYAEKIAKLIEKVAGQGGIDIETKSLFDRGCRRMTNLDIQLKSYIERKHNEKSFGLAADAIKRASTMSRIVLYFPGCELYIAIGEDEIGSLAQDLLDLDNNEQPIAQQVVPTGTPHKLVLFCKKESIESVIEKLQRILKLKDGDIHIQEDTLSMLSIPIIGTHEENINKYHHLIIDMHESGGCNSDLAINEPQDGYLYYGIDMQHIATNSTMYGKLLPEASAALVDRLSVKVDSTANCNNTSLTLDEVKICYVREFIETHSPEGIKTSEYEKMYRKSLGNASGVKLSTFKQTVIDAGYSQERVTYGKMHVWRKQSVRATTLLN